MGQQCKRWLARTLPVRRESSRRAAQAGPQCKRGRSHCANGPAVWLSDVDSGAFALCAVAFVAAVGVPGGSALTFLLFEDGLGD